MNKKIRKVIWATIIFIGIILLGNFYYIIISILNYNIISNYNSFLNNLLFTITLLECFIILLIVVIKQKFFDRCIWIQGKALSVIYLLASIIFPRFKGYKAYYEVIAWGDFTLIDGRLFILGLLFVSLGYIFYIGNIQQDEIDSIL